jgi:type VI secretion system protein
MTLQIRIIKAPDSAPISQNNHIFDERGGSIGRGPDNTWVLPDPERILSSCHCEFVFESGRYHLIDLSTNGTFINSSPEPLGKGTRAQLEHGDVLEIGDYSFSVEIGGVPADSFSLGGANPGMGSPFAAESDFAPESDLSDFPFGESHIDGQPPLSLSPEPDSVDPLQALDQASRPQPVDSIFGAPATAPEPDALFQSEGNQLICEPLTSNAIAWPEAVPENVIPDDWDLDEDLGLPQSDSPLPEEPLPTGLGREDLEATPFEQAGTPLHEPVRQPEYPPAPEAPMAPPRAPVQPIPPVAAPRAPEPPHRPIPRPAGGRQAQAAPPRPESDPLIAAMGLDPSQFDQAGRDELHTLVGSLMRDVVEGLMQAMRARASIKNEFRMNVTTIQPVENNPLKFSADVDEAMENIFVRKSNAYKAPIEAVQEGFQEIAGHQVAMIAGMREAFEEMLKGFDPSVLAQGFRRHQKPGAIAALQNARYWRQYNEHYQGLTDNLERSFQQIFGDVFVQAYEDQLRRLAAVRKP